MPDLQNFGQFNVRQVNLSVVKAGNNQGNATGTHHNLRLTASNDTDDAFVHLDLHNAHAATPDDVNSATFTGSGGVLLKGLLDPVDDQDASTKKYSNDTNGRFHINLFGDILTTISGTSQVWTTANLLSGMIIRNSTSDSTDTLPTAQAMITAITDPVVGTSINLVVQKTGTHRITFSENNGNAAAGNFRVGGGASATSVFVPAIENLRTTTLRIILRNITPDNMVCELALISDR